MMPNDHAEHGRGNAEDGPDDPDCPCRGTDEMRECSDAGCGFCFAEVTRSLMSVQWDGTCRRCAAGVPRVWDGALECYAHADERPGNLLVCETPWRVP